jgi:aminoglycoside phosphotransferase (APT) family kinase protein
VQYKPKDLVLGEAASDGPANLSTIALLRALRNKVPVPEVFYAEPEGIDRLGPFAFIELVNGITFQQLKRTNDLPAIQQASYSVGKTLAAIGQLEFEKPGNLRVNAAGALETGPALVEGSDPIIDFLDRCLLSEVLRRRTGEALHLRLSAFSSSWRGRLPEIESERRLVHSDFGSRNVMVHEVNGNWKVAAVLDWEFAFSGSPLLDVGHFLRYEHRKPALREPHFSNAFVENGGQLPDDWQRLVRVIDLTALLEILTRDQVPDEIVLELLDLIRGTVEDRDHF